MSHTNKRYRSEEISPFTQNITTAGNQGRYLGIEPGSKIRIFFVLQPCIYFCCDFFGFLRELISSQENFGFLSENLLVFPDFFWISFRFVLDFLIKNFRFLPENFEFLLNFVSSHRSPCWISS